MNGSEKQIAWATEIKKSIIESLSLNIALNNAIDSDDDETIEALEVEMMKSNVASIDPEYSNEFLTTLKNVVSGIEDASFFIDTRDHTIWLLASRSGLVFNRDGSDVRVKINDDGSIA